MKKALLILVCAGSISGSKAQNFLNGSFENTTATTCLFNISNAAYNAAMSNVRGIGEREMLDILYDVDCSSYGMAREGHYYCSLENPIDYYIPTAISMGLSSSLMAGKTYTFTYYDKSSGGGGPLEFGLSDDPNTFGTVIHIASKTPASTEWTKKIVSFSAPLEGKYITARYHIIEDSWVFVDDFAMEKSTAIDEQDNRMAIDIFPNPASEQIHIRLAQNAERPQLVRINNQLGQLLYEGVYSAELNISLLPSGRFYLQIYTSSGAFSGSFYKH